jgi:hypothetical protein
MSFADASSQTYIGTVENFGARHSVYCRVAYDDVEFVGRLWFIEHGSPGGGIPDRAAMPGRSCEEVLASARRLTPDELRCRHARAFAERRQYLRLRRVTDEILTKIRFLNQLAIAVQGGLLAEPDVRQEVEQAEWQLHQCVDRLWPAAGVPGPDPTDPRPPIRRPSPMFPGHTRTRTGV